MSTFTGGEQIVGTFHFKRAGGAGGLFADYTVPAGQYLYIDTYYLTKPLSGGATAAQASFIYAPNGTFGGADPALTITLTNNESRNTEGLSGNSMPRVIFQGESLRISSGTAPGIDAGIKGRLFNLP